jgi:hypothetical protein
VPGVSSTIAETVHTHLHGTQEHAR